MEPGARWEPRLAQPGAEMLKKSLVQIWDDPGEQETNRISRSQGEKGQE